MSVEEKILDMGFEDVGYFVNPDYEDAFIGVTSDNHAVYDYDLMVESLMKEDSMSEVDAMEFIDYNTLSAYFGDKTPYILFKYRRD